MKDADVPALALVIPFHNEERYLPRLICSLREQDAPAIPVVFVDNASTDGSAAVVRQCDEVRAGRWICLEEPRIGKFYAMKLAVAYARERYGARSMGFLDGDSHCTGPSWLRDGMEIVQRAGDGFGYTYSPFTYDGFDRLPRFAAAYRAYERVLWRLAREVGWLANGQGFFCSMDVLASYFDRARVTAEIDLRLALLSLLRGRNGYLNPTPIESSGRRVVVNARNFAQWCFYAEEFYVTKDINSPRKTDLHSPEPIEDLPAEMVGRFFARRALKLTARHLVPLLLAERNPKRLACLQTVLGGTMPEGMALLFSEAGLTVSDVLGTGFDDLTRALAQHPAARALAAALAAQMREHLESGGGPAVSSG